MNHGERRRSKSQMAEADPLYVSAICFFRSGGPGDFKTWFQLGGSHPSACLRPARTPLSSSRAYALWVCGSPALRPRQLLQVTQGPTRVCLGQQRPSYRVLSLRVPFLIVIFAGSPSRSAALTLPVGVGMTDNSPRSLEAATRREKRLELCRRYVLGVHTLTRGRRGFRAKHAGSEGYGAGRL